MTLADDLHDLAGCTAQTRVVCDCLESNHLEAMTQRSPAALGGEPLTPHRGVQLPADLDLVRARPIGQLQADEFPNMDVVSPHTVGGTSTVLHLYTEDVDALWTRAVAAGAPVLHPLQDQFWGDRQGQLTDPFGHHWGLATHVRDPWGNELLCSNRTSPAVSRRRPCTS